MKQRSKIVLIWLFTLVILIPGLLLQPIYWLFTGVWLLWKYFDWMEKQGAMP